MSYITKDYLITQFTNFATRLGLIFAKKTEIPTKISDLSNDSNFVTKAVNDLENYYNKNNTYNKTEINNLITTTKSGMFVVVDALPTENISTTSIYLTPATDVKDKNIKDEWINLDGTSNGWEKIGSTAVDLSGYLKTSDAESTYIKITDKETSNIDFSSYFE